MRYNSGRSTAMHINVDNRTIFCHDNLDIMRGINSECIDLIYLDPPFNKKKTFTAPIGSSAEGASFKDIFTLEDVKEEWVQTIREDQLAIYRLLEAVKDIEGTTSYNFCYLAYMAIRLIECHRILKETGSIYLHCDPTMSHYLKILMDCVFGEKNFRNEIVWRIGWVSGFKTQKKGWIRNHDTILYYVKSSLANDMFNKEYIPYAEGYTRRDGKKPSGKGIPIEDTWNCHEGDRLDSVMIKSFSKKTGYPTEKPLELLERIIQASSNKNDIVLDPFCGCATTCVAAEKLERQWIGIDIGVKAYELVQTRIKDEIYEQGLLKGENGNLPQIHFRTYPPQRTDRQRGAVDKKYVYIIADTHSEKRGQYKVGVAKDIKQRLVSLQTGNPLHLEVKYQLHTEYYREIEAYIHASFDRDNEWVWSDAQSIINKIRSYQPPAPIGRAKDM